MNIIKKFQLKIVIFSAVKNRCILHGRVFVMLQCLCRYNMSKTDSFDEVLHHLLHNIYDCHLDHLENLILEGVTNAFTNTLSE